MCVRKASHDAPASVCAMTRRLPKNARDGRAGRQAPNADRNRRSPSAIAGYRSRTTATLWDCLRVQTAPPKPPRAAPKG